MYVCTYLYFETVIEILLIGDLRFKIRNYVFFIRACDDQRKKSVTLTRIITQSTRELKIAVHKNSREKFHFLEIE